MDPFALSTLTNSQIRFNQVQLNFDVFFFVFIRKLKTQTIIYLLLLNSHGFTLHLLLVGTKSHGSVLSLFFLNDSCFTIFFVSHKKSNKRSIGPSKKLAKNAAAKVKLI